MRKWTPERVRELRQRFGLSQTLFGELLGLSLRTIQSIESGERAVTRTQSLALSYIDMEGENA